jgi:hypothetical protein
LIVATSIRGRHGSYEFDTTFPINPESLRYPRGRSLEEILAELNRPVGVFAAGYMDVEGAAQTLGCAKSRDAVARQVPRYAWYGASGLLSRAIVLKAAARKQAVRSRRVARRTNEKPVERSRGLTNVTIRTVGTYQPEPMTAVVKYIERPKKELMRVAIRYVDDETSKEP